MNSKTSKIIAAFACLLLILIIITFIHKEKSPSKNIIYKGTFNSSSIVVPVTINDRKYQFLVDTGASVNFVSQEVASHLSPAINFNDLPKNLKTEFHTITTAAGSMDGKNLSYIAAVPYLIGNFEISDEYFWGVIDTKLISKVTGFNIDGIIGIEAFRKMNWIFDNKNQEIQILSSALPIKSFDGCMGYNDERNGAPEIAATYRSKDRVMFRVDTGADTSSAPKEFIDYTKKIGVKSKPTSTSALTANGLDKTSNLYIIKEWSFDEKPFGSIQLNENQDGLFYVGMDFMSHFQKYAFFPSKMLFCYSAPSLEKFDTLPLRKIGVAYIDDHIEIFPTLEDETLKYGLTRGDIVVEANNRSYKPREINSLRKIIRETPIGKLHLKINRKSKIIDIVL